MNKEHKIRLPDDVSIKKLEDLINIELSTIEEIVNLSDKVVDKLKSMNVPEEVKESLISSYQQRISDIVHNTHIGNIASYVSLLAFSKVLHKEGKLYAFESNWGDFRVTYIPYIIVKNELLKIDYKRL